MAESKSKSEAPKGLSDGNPKRKVVGDYPERPYGEAISDEHRAVLAEKGLTVSKKTELDPTVAPGA